MHIEQFLGQLLLVEIGESLPKVKAIVAPVLQLLGADRPRPFFGVPRAIGSSLSE